MEFHRHTDQIFSIDNFLSRAECQSYIELSEKNGYEAAKINTEVGQKVVSQVRNNNRSFYNSLELADKLWERLKPFIPEQMGNSIPIGLNELFRFYRYLEGQQFRGHFDESYIRNETEASYLTFLIYLNDDFEGGETTFPGVWVNPKVGKALIFRHDIYHSGREVTNGRKYVLRSDVMYKLIE